MAPVRMWKSLALALGLAVVTFNPGCGSGGGEGGGGNSGASGSSGPNRGPTANNDSASIAIGGVASINVLANDTDLDGDPLTIQSFSQGSFGTVSQGPGSFLVYTPPGAFSGTDSFQYTITDGELTATATVTVLVAAPNQSPNLNIAGIRTVTEDAALPVVVNNTTNAITDIDSGSGDLLVTLSANDGVLSLATTTGLSFQIGDGLNDAVMVFEGTQTELNNALNGLGYKPDADFVGTDTVFVFVDDQGNTGSGGNKSASTSFNMTVNGVNDRPVVTAPADQTVAEDTNLTMPSFTVVDVDADPDDVLVTFSAASGSLTLSTTTGLSFVSGDGTQDTSMQFRGTVLEVSNALFAPIFRSGLNFVGTDTVTLTVNDEGNNPSGALQDSDSLQVVVTAVNDAPVISLPATQNTSEEAALPINGIVVSDVDAGGSLIQVTMGVSNGRMTLSSTAGLVFSSGDGTSDPSMAFQASLSDIASALTTVTYVGDTNFIGTDVLQISVNDRGFTGAGGAKGDSDTLTINVGQVNDAPSITNPGAQSVDEDNLLQIFSISTSDPDDPDNTTIGDLVVEVDLQVAQGVLSLASLSGLTFSNGDGVQDAQQTFQGSLSSVNAALSPVFYLPNLNYNGADTLAMQVSDLGNTGFPGTPLTSNTNVAITVNAVNDAPIVTGPPTFTLDEDVPTGMATYQIVDVDSDEAPGPLRVIMSVNNGRMTLASTANLTFTSGTGTQDALMNFTGLLADLNTAIGTVTYVTVLDYNGPDTLSMLVDDQGNTGSGGPLTDSTATAITVLPINDSPVSTDVAQSISEDTTDTIQLLSADVDLDPLTYAIVTQPTSGTLTNFDPVNGTVDYIADLNYFGPDSFTFRTNDGTVDSNVATVSLTVTPVNDRMFAALDTAETLRGLPVTIDVLANDEDIDGDALTVAAFTQPTSGAVSDAGGGNLTYTPNPQQLGFDRFTYTVEDGNGAQWVGTVMVKTEGFPVPTAIERVSLVNGVTQATEPSQLPSLSGDGRYVAFQTDEELLATDVNPFKDIYVVDRLTSAVTLVSVDSLGAVADGASFRPSISEDGRFVAFESDATNLLGAGADNNGVRDIFVHDLQTSVTVRASETTTGGNGLSRQASLSADGRFVVYSSAATNFVTDTNGQFDCYLTDLQLNTVTLVSPGFGGAFGDADCLNPTVSRNGATVAFSSAASNLVTPAMTNGVLDVYVHTGGTTTLISSLPAGGEVTGAAAGPSALPRITPDGRWVAFSSQASELVTNDINNNTEDAFLHDLQTSVTRLVSLNSAETQSNGASNQVDVSDDGRFVVFTSASNNLVSPDSNGVTANVFVRDRRTGQTQKVDRSSTGTQDGTFSAQAASISGDGQFVAFDSQQTVLVTGDTNGLQDVFVGPNPLPDQPSRINLAPDRSEADSFTLAVSADLEGRWTAFDSGATNLVPGDTNGLFDVFVHDARTGVSVRASIRETSTEADGLNTDPSLGWDGRFVSFTSEATNLIDPGVSPPGDTNGVADIYVRDLRSEFTQRVSVDSVGVQANGASSDSALSADGRYVAFVSAATNLIDGGTDDNASNDVFVHDRLLGDTTRVSVGKRGLESNGPSSDPAISPDGRYVVFSSLATNLIEGVTPPAARHVYLHDTLFGTTELVSVDTGGTIGDGDSTLPAVSEGGTFVAFRSAATNLVGGDGNGAADVFLRDRTSGSESTARVSVDTLGNDSDGASSRPSISRDGEFVLFLSDATDLVGLDGNSQTDVFVRDIANTTTRRISQLQDGTGQNQSSLAADLSGDARRVVFQSPATNLETPDNNLAADAFSARNTLKP